MKITKIAALFLALVMLFTLASCGGGDDSKDTSGGAGEESLEIKEEQAKAKMKELAEKDGYLISFIYTDNDGSNGTQTIAKKNGIVWSLSSDKDGEDTSGFAYLAEGNSVHVFNYEDESWVYSSTVNDETGSSMISNLELYTIDIWLFYANTFDGSLTKGADTTICGRPCYTYSCGYDFSAFGISAGFSYKVAVDKEFGITLSMEIEATDNEEKSKESFTVTEFKTGKDVAVPELPKVVSLLDKIGISIDDFKCSGISSASVLTQSPALMMIGATPAVANKETFNAWGSAIFSAIKKVADEGSLEDVNHSPFTEWKTVETTYAVIYFAVDGTDYQIMLTDSYESLGSYSATVTGN